MTTATQTVPDKHSSIVGGSTAARRIACPASYRLEQQVPEDKTGSSASQEGTVLHEMMTKLLLDPDLEPESLLPFTFTHADGWVFTLSHDVWVEKGVPALDAFLDYMESIERETGAEFTYLVEKSCEMPGIEGAFGTSDIIWKCGNLSGVWDWKFGYRAVKAEANEQLMFYARAAMNTFPEMFAEAAEIELAIMQPMRSDEPDVWTTHADELELFRMELVAAVDAAANAHDPVMARGKHCDFARCKSVCPLHLNPTQRLAEKLGLRKDQDAEEQAAGSPPLADDEALDGHETFIEMLPDLLELAVIAEDYAKEVFARAASLSVADEAVREMLRPHGWGLKEGRAGNLAWIADQKKIEGALRRRGLKKADFIKQTLISPTQAGKKLEALGAELPDKLAERPAPKGPTFGRLYPDTKEYQSHAARARDLGERLAKLA